MKFLFVTGVPEEDMKNLYVCPPNFVRNGNSCCFFSTHMATGKKPTLNVKIGTVNWQGWKEVGKIKT
jgi:hypothetical protein